MQMPRLLRACAAAAVLAAIACSGVGVARAADLGIEGTIFEPVEEDLRVLLMKLVASHDWQPQQQELKESALNYTKNLPAYFLPRAEKTLTRWKDVGIVTTEDIYLPSVDWQNGSVFNPGKVLAAPAGTYLNPIAKLPSRGIERLFVFDATDPDQLTFARALMVRNIPQLSFMVIAGDVGELSTEMNRPIYHAIPTMLEKFHIVAVPTLIGFGKGAHQGHMALTEFALPGASLDDVTKAWFGLPYSGYDPDSISDDVLAPPVRAVVPAPDAGQAAAAAQGDSAVNGQQALQSLLSGPASAPQVPVQGDAPPTYTGEQQNLPASSPTPAQNGTQP